MSDITAPPLYHLDALENHFAPRAERFCRATALQRSGLYVLHLSLAPGQRVPLHRHPGHHVLLQGLSGKTTVQLENEQVVLKPQHLLAFEGECAVSPHNDGDAPSAVLITLVRRA